MKMKRNQKILALLLVFMLFVSMLSACAGRASTPQTRGYLDSDGKTHIISGDDTDDEEVYDGPDDSEDGLAPAVPDFTGTETAELIAPYHALAVEYNGYIYYLDRNTNLCRADTNMKNYEMVLAHPLDNRLLPSANSTAYICGVTNAGMIYIGSTKGSCYLDANSADLWPLTTTTFSGAENPVQVFGISGEWMYYTKDRDTDKYLYRCKLGGAFDTEEQVFDFTICDAALTEDYIVLVCDGFKTLGYQRLDDLQKDGMNEIDSVSKYRTDLALATVQDELVVYDLSDDAYALGSKLCTINLRDGTTHRGTNIWGLRGYGYYAKSDSLFYFDKHLSRRPVQEIEADASYSNANAYQSSEYLKASDCATVVGDWLFFKGKRDSIGSDLGGANFFIGLDGMTLNSLD